MTELIDDPADVVPEVLEGVALTQPGIALLEGRTIAVRSDAVREPGAPGPDDRPVAVVSGGGAGHEPAHAGFVAAGMLAAAVAGDVFASPSVDAVLDGIRAVTGPAGCLLVVKNYTGDRLNFGLAAELARREGLDVETVVVADDVALADSGDTAGRRGLAGTVLVHKVAGALAARGASLAQVAEAARRVASGVGTMGAALTGATPPGASAAGFDLPAGQVELGLGIHGEPGASRETLTTAEELVDTLVERVVADRGPTGRVVALVGSAGGTSPMELDVCARAAVRSVRDRGLELERLWVGPVMTSLDMVGVSVTLLAVDDELLAALDAPTAALAWPGRPDGSRPRLERVAVPAPPAEEADRGEPDPRVREAIDAACERLLAARDELDEADRSVGDGDLGSTLARGARAWRDDPIEGSAPAMLRHLGALVRRDVGGTSGPLYSILLLRAAESLEAGGDWAAAFAAGVEGVRELGGAQPGDGTMVDALAPAADAAPRGWDAVLEAARRGAASTADRVATKGRASYLGERAKGHADPGASAVVLWLSEVASVAGGRRS